MKSLRLTLSLLASLVAVAPAVAILGFGDIVFNPVQHAWEISKEAKELAHWAEEIKKFQDFVSKQLRTIEEINDMKGQITGRIGDWKGVYDRAVSLRNRADNLRATLGHNWRVTAMVDAGTPALNYTAHGNYQSLDLKTTYGTSFDYDDARLKRYNTIYAQHADLETSLDKANSEIADILTEIADTSKEIIESTDQEKLAKLQEKKSTLTLRLTELQRQLDQKIKLLQVQATLNENRAAMEQEVERERMRRSFRESRERDAKIGG